MATSVSLSPFTSPSTVRAAPKRAQRWPCSPRRTVPHCHLALCRTKNSVRAQPRRPLHTQTPPSPGLISHSPPGERGTRTPAPPGSAHSNGGPRWGPGRSCHLCSRPRSWGRPRSRSRSERDKAKITYLFPPKAEHGDFSPCEEKSCLLRKALWSGCGPLSVSWSILVWMYCQLEEYMVELTGSEDLPQMVFQGDD